MKYAPVIFEDLPATFVDGLIKHVQRHINEWPGPPGEMLIEVRHEPECPCNSDDEPDGDRCDCDVVDVRFCFYATSELQ